MSKDQKTSTARAPFVRIAGEPYVAWWRERFGLSDEAFHELSFYQRGKSTVWVATAGIDRLEATRAEAVGLPLLRIGSRYWKPTGVAIVALAQRASRNVVELETCEAQRFLAGEECSLAAGDSRHEGLEIGYVIVRYRGVPIGCGEWHPPTLHSCVPKGKRLANVEL